MGVELSLFIFQLIVIKLGSEKVYLELTGCDERCQSLGLDRQNVIGRDLRQNGRQVCVVRRTQIKSKLNIKDVRVHKELYHLQNLVKVVLYIYVYRVQVLLSKLNRKFFVIVALAEEFKYLKQQLVLRTLSLQIINIQQLRFGIGQKIQSYLDTNSLSATFRVQYVIIYSLTCCQYTAQINCYSTRNCLCQSEQRKTLLDLRI
ncbi:Hypothetical_protein [Hexamita inflata]|uniref:Hypothetical_protein n=1 Tax=Hexamita inflata TaxID=28002 RepID=A0AA86UD82_9EUKA|nr:Hypothetical protein HINF_LOCUS24858 [Hexamita inflata]